MRNGRLRSVLSFVVCSIMMAIVTIATNIFTNQNHATVYADEATVYTSKDGLYSVDSNGVLRGYLGTETLLSVPSAISVDTTSPADGVEDLSVTVTAIGEGAFSGNTTIIKVVLPNTVTAIHSASAPATGAFSGCTALGGVVTTNLALTSIGDYAFYGCSTLTSLGSVDNGVVDLSQVVLLGISAFDSAMIMQNTSLSSIETIGYNAFRGCEAIIHIPQNLDGIKYYSPNYITPVAIENVTNVVDSTKESFATSTIYTNNEKVLTYLNKIGYENYMSTAVGITGVDCVKIGESFDLRLSYQGNLSSKKLYKNDVVILDSITDSKYTDTIDAVGEYVYKIELVDIFGEVFEDTFTVLALATDDFKDFTVVDGVLTKYNGTATEVTVPEYIDATYNYGHITSIGKGAFVDTAVTKVTLASSITTIEDADDMTTGAFYNTAIVELISEDNALINMGNYAFYGCSGLTTIKANNLKTVGDYGLYGCSHLDTIGDTENNYDLDSVEEIGIYAFRDASISGKIVLSSIKVLGEGSLSNSAIAYVYIPKTNDIKVVSNAHSEGVNIEDVEDIYITDNYKIYSSNSDVITYLNNVSQGYIYVSASFTCSNDIVVVGESVTIDTFTTTGDIATSKWYVNGVETTIIENKYITLNTIGENVITLKVTDVYGEEAESSGHTVMVFADDSYRDFTVVDGVLTKYNGTDSVVTVPHYLDEASNYGEITTIGEGAFKDCYGLVEVTLDSAITAILDSAFENCVDLVKVNAPGVTTIGDKAFSGCTVLDTYGATNDVVNLDTVTHIGVSAFENNLFVSVVLKNVQLIGENAFTSDSNYLQYIAIGNYESIAIKNGYDIETAIQQSTSMIAGASVKIYSVNPDVIAYATTNGLTYETLSAEISVDKANLVKGESATFTSMITGVDVRYVWLNGGANIAGATSATYADTSATAVTKNISLKVTDVLGNEVTSNVIKIRYYSDNSYTLFEVSDSGVLIKYHGTATNVIVPEYVDVDTESGRITSISKGAFRGNATLSQVTLPSSVTMIESATTETEGAFYGCSELNKMTVTSALTHVGDWAFSGCRGLVRFTINGTDNDFTNLVYVGIAAFSGTNVSGVILEDIITIGENAFIDIATTNYVGIDSDSTAIKLKTAQGETAIAESSARFTDSKIYTNNAKVVEYATLNSYDYMVTSVTISGDSVATIGNDVTIVANAVGDGITYYWSKSGLTITPDVDQNTNPINNQITVTSATKGNVTYTVSVTDIFGDTYTKDHTVRYYPDNNYIIYVVEDGVLTKYNGTETEVVIPEYVYIDDPSTRITSIGGQAFTGNTTITKVTIPSSVVSILDATAAVGAFRGCTALSEVVYTTSLVSIGDYAFYGCSALDALKVEDTHTMAHITSVGVEAFFNSGLSEVKLVNVETIGYRAFVQCVNLDNLVIGNKDNIKLKQTSGNKVDIVSATEKITNTNIYTANEDIIAYAGAAGIAVRVPSVTIGKWQAVVDDGDNPIPENNRVVDTRDITAFINDSVSIVAKVEGLNPTYVWTVNGVTQGALTTKDVTQTMSSAGKKVYVLTMTDELGNVATSNELVVMCYASQEEYEFVVEDGVLVQYNGNGEVVNIPSMVGGKTITTIGKDTFNGNVSITELVLANTITTIEGADTYVEGAFFGCSALTSVVSAGNALANIGDYAFYGCSNLETISANAITTIGNYALYNTTSLSQIGVIVDTYNLTKVVSLGVYAIYANNSVKEIYFDDITTMGEYAIRSNAALKILYIGNALTQVSYISLQGATVTENLVSSTRTIIELISSADGSVYVYNNPTLCTYLDANRIDYTETKISTLSYSGRVLVNTDAVITADANGLEITYAWFEGESVTPISNGSSITINEATPGTYTYKLVITDAVGNVCEETATVVVVEYENELYFIVEDSILTDYLGVNTEVVVPTYKNGTSGEVWITSIGQAFSGNTTVTKVVLGSGVTKIEDSAFLGATALTTLVVTDNLVTIGNNAFAGLNRFRLFTIDGTTNNLTHLVTIGASAFSNTGITSVVLTNVESIGEGAFTGVSTSIVMIGDKDNIVITYNGGSEDIATSNRLITDRAIYSPNADVVTYALNNNIETFSTLTASITADKTLVAKETVVTLTSVTNGHGLTYKWFADGVEIDGETSSTLTTTSNTVGKVTYSLEVTDLMGGKVTSNGVEVEYLINENYVNFVVENGVLISYIGTGSEVVVPNYLDATDFNTIIHTISITAFRGNTNITSIRFGNNVRSIEGIVANDDNTNLNTAAFYGCTALREVVFDRLVDVTVGDYAFYNTRSLKSVEFSADEVSLGAYAFYNNTALTEVVSVTDVTIDKYTFSGCTALTRVGTRSNTVKVTNTTLPEYAFFRCSSVSQFDLSQVEEIETCALNSCSGVSDLLLTKVTRIAANAIYIDTSARVNIVINKDITSEGLSVNSIAGARVTLYSTIDSYVKTFAEANRITFVGVNVTGYETSYVYPINSDYTLSVTGTGYGTLTYAWYKDGSLVQTSHSNEFVISSTTPGVVVYKVTLTDSVGYTYTSQEIAVTYVKDYYDVEASIGTDGANNVGGQVSVGNTAAYLGEYDITVTIENEYRLYSVTINGDEINIADFVSNGNVYTYTVENVDTDQNIVVTTKLLAYDVVVNVDSNVILITPNNMMVDSGRTAVISFELKAHYDIEDIKLDGVSIDLDTLDYESTTGTYTYSIDNVLKDMTVDITTTLSYYTVNTVTTTGGALATAIDGSYVYGTSITVTPVAEDHYNVSSVKLNGIEVTLKNGSYTFNLTEDTEVSLTFALQNMVVTSILNGGTLTQNKVNVPYGTNGTITFESTASKVYSITIDGDKVENIDEIVSKSGNTYSVTVASVTKDITVSIVMGVYITIDSYTNITTSPANTDGKILVPYNTNQSIIISANAGYILTSVKLEDTEKLTNSVDKYILAIDSVVAEKDVQVVATRLYTVSASMTNGSIVTPTSTISVEDGSSTEVEFRVNDNYSLSSITVNGESVEIDGNSNLTQDASSKVYTLVIDSVTSNTVVSVEATINKVAVTLTVGGNGTVKIGDNTYTNETVNVEIDYGTNLTFTTRPASEYIVDKIVYNGSEIDTAASVVTNVTSATNTLNITFKLTSYLVQTAPGDSNVTIVSAATQTVESGSDVTVRFTLTSHYHYNNIKVNGAFYTGQVLNNDGTYSFVVEEVKANLTIQIFSAIDTYTITVGSVTNGTVNPSGNVSVSYGSSQAFTFTPNTGYELLEDNIVVTNVDTGAVMATGWSFSNNVVTIDRVENNVSIVATITKATSYYNVNLVSSETVYPVTPSALTSVAENTNYVFEFEIATNYVVKNILINGTQYTGTVSEEDGVYSITYTITSDTTVVVNTSIKQYTVTVNIGDHGTVSPSSVTVNHGSNQTFVISPDSGYDIDTVTLDGVRQDVSGNSYSINNITKDMTLAVTFKEKLPEYDITINIYGGTLENGTTTKTTVVRENDATLYFKANSNYHLSSIVLDGENVSIDVLENASLSYTDGVYAYAFTDVRASHSMTVTFVIDTVDVLVNVTGDGSVTPKVNGGVYTVNYGASQSFTFTRLAGFVIESITVNGVLETIADNTTHTVELENITTTYEIDVLFVALPNVYVVNVSSSTVGGSITSGAGRNAVTSGETLDIYVTVDVANQYVIDSVNIDGENLDLTNSDNITDSGNGNYIIHILDVTSNKSIMVVFGLRKYNITINYNDKGAVYYGEDVVASGSAIAATYTGNLTIQLLADADYELLAANIDTSISTDTNAGMYYEYLNNMIVIYNISSDATITLDFTERPVYYSVNVTTDSNITITSTVDSTILKGSDLEIEFTVADNYIISALEINNETKDIDSYITHSAGTYTFAMTVTANANISIATALVEYEVTITNDGNGTIHIGDSEYVTQGTHSVKHGSNLEISIVPSSGYEIATITLDGESVEVTNKQTQSVILSGVSGEHSIAVTFSAVIVYHKVTVSVGLGGSATNSGINQVVSGEAFSTVFTPEANYVLTAILVNGEAIDLDASGVTKSGDTYTYAIASVTEDVVVKAVFSLITLDITFNTTAFGTVNIAGTDYTNSPTDYVIKATYGTNLEFVITPDAGYRLTKFELDGNNVAITENTYTLANITQAHSVNVEFSKIEYTVSILASSNGVVSTDSITVAHGDDATFTITPDTGYVVSKVYVDGVEYSASLTNNAGTYTCVIEDIESNHSVRVEFKLKTLAITVVVTGNGSVDVSTLNVNYYETKTIHIYPDTNNHLADVLDNTVSVIAGIEEVLGGYSYTITNIVVDHTINVVFEVDKVEVTTTITGATGSATINKDEVTEVDYGSDYTVEIVVNSGYILQSVYVSGVQDETLIDKSSGTYTLTVADINKDTDIEIVVIKDTYTVNVGSGITIDGGNTVAYKGSKTIYVDVTSTTDLVSLTVGNTTMDANDVMFDKDNSRYVYTIENITADIAVVAETKTLHNLYVTVVGDQAGIVVEALNGRDTVATGEDKVYKLTLATDYYVYKIKLSDGTNVEDVALNTLVAVDDYYLLNIDSVTTNLDIVITIATGSYKITIESGDNGKTIPESEIGVSYPGEDKMIVFYPDAHYTIDYVELDGDSANRLYVDDLGVDAYGNYYYEFIDIFASHTLKVEFKLIEYSITINTMGTGFGGEMTNAGNKTSITYGSSIDYTLEVESGYVLVKMLRDGVEVDGFSNLTMGEYSYTLSNVVADTVFELHFADSEYEIDVSVNDSAMGSVNATAVQVVAYGEDYTFEFTANAGYILKDVLLDGTSVMADVVDNTYTLENVTNTYTLDVIYDVKRTITITVNDESAGYVNVGTGEYAVVDGSAQNIGIFVNYGYMIADIKVDGVSLQDIDSLYNEEDGGYYYAITSVTRDYAVDITLVKTTYNVRVTKTSGGNVSPYSINPIVANYNSSIEFTMTPYANYVLKSIVVGGTDVTDLCTNVSGVYKYTLAYITEDYLVEVSFASSTNNIVITTEGEGSVTPEPSGNIVEIPFNGSQSFTFTAGADYVISSLVVDSEEVTLATGKTEYYYSFNRVQTGHTVSVTYVPSTYNVEVTASQNGTVDKVGSNAIAFLSSIAIAITPDDGYTIKAIMVDSEDYDLSALTENDGVYILNITGITKDYTVDVTFDVAYEVTATSNIDTAVSFEGEFTPVLGSTQAYIIRISDGYMVTTILVDGVEVIPSDIYDVTNDCYVVEFNSITDNHTIDVTVVQTGYTITITSNEGGHTNEIGSIVVDYASSRDIIITPDEHYHVVSIKLDGVDITDSLQLVDGAYTVAVENVVSDRTVDVVFELDFVYIELVINNTYGGYVVPSNSVTLRYGEDQSYEINVYEDYVLAEVRINDTDVVDLETIRLNLRKYLYSFDNVTTDQKIEITYARARYYVQNTASSGGTVSNSQYVNYGEDYKCYIIPSDHYQISSVMVNDTPIDIATLEQDEIGYYLEFTNVSENYNIRASFELQRFTITVNIENDTYGTVDYASNVVVYGNSMTFNISANEGYIIASVVVDGNAQNNLNTYVFDYVTSDHTIDIKFAKSTYRVETHVTSGAATGYVEAPSSVAYGNDLVIMLYPASHYEISGLVINGKVEDITGITDRIVIEDVDDDYIVDITFSFTHYSITLEESEGGVITGDTTANPVESKTYKIEVLDGYEFSKLYVNDVEVVATLNTEDGCYYYQLININDDYVIRAEFTINQFSITFVMNNAAWGNILPTPAGGVAKVTHGSDYSVVIRPRDGYIVSSVLVDDEEYAVENNTIVFTSVTSDHTVRINFVINKKYTISSYQYTNNGSIVVNSEALVGQKVAFSVTPSEGYKVKSINIYDGNGNAITYDPQAFTFTMPNSTVNIRVEYEKIVVDEPGDDPTPPVDPEPPVDSEPPTPPVAPPAEGGVDVVMIVVIVIVAVLAVGAVVTVVVIVIIKKKNQPYFHSK